jgi:hypothetical protein
MHKDILPPVEIHGDIIEVIKGFFSVSRSRIPIEHFTYCFDSRNFSLASVRLIIRVAMGGLTSGGAYVACCGTETTIICYENQVMGWFMDRGMSHESALTLLVAVNRRNAHRYV